MAKVKITEVLICGDCGGEIIQCVGCKEYFKNGENIICQEDGIYQEHYCDACKDEVKSNSSQH